MRKLSVVAVALSALVGMTAAAAAAPAGQPAEKAVGNVVSVNPRTRTVIIKETAKGEDGRQVAFTMGDRGRIEFKDKVGRMNELKVGDVVTVEFHPNKGRFIADAIHVARNARPKLPKPGKKG